MFASAAGGGTDQSIIDFLKANSVGRKQLLSLVCVLSLPLAVIMLATIRMISSNGSITERSQDSHNPSSRAATSSAMTAPTTRIGDTPFGQWLQKFAAEGNSKQRLVPGTQEHKEDRWKQYKERGGPLDYERWSKAYNLNMKRAKSANKAMDDFHKRLG